MKIYFVLMIIAFLGANYYVFQRIWMLLPPTRLAQVLLVSFAVVVIASMFIFFLFGNSLSVGLTSIFYKIGTSWIFIFIFLFILTLVKDLLRITPLVPGSMFTYYTRDNWVGLCLAFGFLTMLMVCGYLKYEWKVKVELPIVTEKKLQNKDSIRIVAISDLHLGYHIGANELREWIQLINKEKPDIILIAGDIIDISPRPLKEGNYARYFKEFEAPLGVYSCLGNHEYLSGIKSSVSFLEESGIQLLRDSHVLVDSCFYVVGRDDRTNPERKPLSNLLLDLDRSKPVILLDHQPFKLEEAEANAIDLQISGHTHRGQIFPISLITDWIYEQSHGYLKKGNTNYYVTSGIGVWGGKFRIGTQSEYVVIDIKQQ